MSMKSYGVGLSLFDLFYLAYYTLGPSILWQMVKFILCYGQIISHKQNRKTHRLMVARGEGGWGLGVLVKKGEYIKNCKLVVTK